MYTVEILNSPAATAGRIARKVVFVAWIERQDRKVFELDADNQAHAERLCRVWLRPCMGALSASVRKVDAKGKTKALKVLSPGDALEETAA